MINILKLKLFPFYTKEIYIPSNAIDKYNIIFFPENTTFLNVYQSLKIRRQYCKRITYPKNVNPMLIVNMTRLKIYKTQSLIPSLAKENLKTNNSFVDVSPFLDLLDSKYAKGSYRRPIILSKISKYINSCLTIGESKKSILLYYVDITKKRSPDIFKWRLWYLLNLAKSTNAQFPFDVLCLAVKYDDGVKYFSIYNKTSKHMTYPQIFSIFRRILHLKDSDIK